MPKYNTCPKQNEIDIYPRCNFNCIYCITEDNKDKITYFSTDSLNNYIKEADKTWPFYLSPWTDCYPPSEAKHKKTRKILSLLRSQNFSYFVVTKNILVYRDIDLFKNYNNAFIAVSLNTIDNAITGLFEPDVPSATERKDMIEDIVGQRNTKLVIKIDPVIPGITDGKNLQNLLEWIKKVKPYAVTSETLRVSATILSKMSEHLPASIFNTIKGYYNSVGDIAQHPELSYRLKIINEINNSLTAAGIKACFCRATLKEPLNAFDCRGGFN